MIPIHPLGSRAASNIRFLLVSTLILWLALWVRLSHLYSLPVFVDEGLHIVWAQRFASGGSYYPFLMDGKILLVVILSLFHVIGPAPLWISRLVIAIFATLGCGASIAAGKLVGSQRIGLLSGVIYAFLPFAVFHDRQVLADSFMADFGAVAVFFTLLTAKPREGRAILPLALSLAATILAKLFGVTYFAFIVSSALVLPSSWKHRRALMGRYAIAGALSIVAASGFAALLYPRLGYNDNTLFNQRVGFVGCPAIICQGDIAKQFDNLQQAWASVADFIPPYFGWSLVALAVAAWPVAYKRASRKIAAIGLSVFAILFSLMLGVGAGSAIVLPARYAMMLAMPVAVLAAYGLLTTADRASLLLIKISPIRQSRSSLTLVVAGLLALLTLIPPMTNTVPIVFSPRKGSYPSFDLWQYFNGRYGGYGFYEAVSTIKARESGKALPPVVIVYGEYVQMVGAYFDRTRVDVRALGEVFPPEIGQWLSQGQSIYVIDEINPAIPASPCLTAEGMMCYELDRYLRHPYWEQDWAVRLRLATGADKELRQKLFSEFFINPEKLHAEYQSLIETLPTTEPVTLLVYPPNHAAEIVSALANRSNITIHPIGDSWPLDVAGAKNELSKTTTDAGLVKIVLIEEIKGDPDRAIETWLSTHLFRFDEQWFGPVRMVGFIGSKPIAETIRVGAQFGDSILLESIEMIDANPAPGSFIRLRLNWRAIGPISQNFKIFFHIFSDDRIVAQHDGQPVSELRSTTTWQTDETIIDQFVIHLPADVLPGAYGFRIGLYDLTTQERLSAITADGVLQEFYIGGPIVVK
jgi:4-amino-4-deoxy-L-arabinose transferase-like glycosyltransferase